MADKVAPRLIARADGLELSSLRSEAGTLIRLVNRRTGEMVWSEGPLGGLDAVMDACREGLERLAGISPAGEGWPS